MYKNNVGKWDKTFKIWDVASGTCKATLAGHSSWVTCVQLNPRVQGQNSKVVERRRRQVRADFHRT